MFGISYRNAYSIFVFCNVDGDNVFIFVRLNIVDNGVFY